jgi:uncharacterized protein (DUF427 family)
MAERVRLESVPRIQVRAAGQPIVDTARGYAVHEADLPLRYYVPRDEVRAELSDGQGSAMCPWKGTWKHLDVTAAGQRIANAAWTYTDPTPVCEPIRGFISFYPNKVEITV